MPLDDDDDASEAVAERFAEISELANDDLRKFAEDFAHIRFMMKGDQRHVLHLIYRKAFVRGMMSQLKRQEGDWS